VDGVTGNSITYRECYEQSEMFGRSLQGLGAKKGDVMAIFMPNNIEYPLVLTGNASIGVISTTLNPVYTANEISKQMELSGTSWAITTRELLPVMKAAVTKLKGDVQRKTLENRIFVVGG
jgi:4-coumarate--CoA ligase